MREKLGCMLENPCIRLVLTDVSHPANRVRHVGSENPAGADNQQGSRVPPPLGSALTPQRLHAELLATDAKGLEAYLQGKDPTTGSCLWSGGIRGSVSR